MSITRAVRRPMTSLLSAVLGASLTILPAAGSSDPGSGQSRETTADTQRAAPVRVMVEGDSLSQGFSGDTTWRYWVDSEFERQGVPVDFVGPHRGTSQGADNPVGGRYARPFDADHASRVGSQLFGPGHLGTIRERTATYDPDVIVLMIGYNDLRRGGKSAKQVAAGVRTFVKRVHAVSPDTRVVIGKLMNALDRFHKRRPMANKAYNRLLVQFAKGRPRITIAQTDVGWKPRKWTTDGVHPNPTGESVFAQRFAMALHRAGVLPRPSALVRRLQWQPRVTSNLAGGRNVFRIAWPDQKAEWTITRFIVVYTRVGSGVRKRVATREEALTLNGLPAGRYTVRTIPVRKQMQGKPTAPTRVRVLPPKAGDGPVGQGGSLTSAS